MNDNERLKKIRSKSGLSIKEFARLVDRHPSTVCRWESGEVPIPRNSWILNYVICGIERLKGKSRKIADTYPLSLLFVCIVVSVETKSADAFSQFMKNLGLEP